ncbi:MAG: tetratricopeptide repeat protein [Candidatus Kapaibacterium sp.]
MLKILIYLIFFSLFSLYAYSQYREVTEIMQNNYLSTEDKITFLLELSNENSKQKPSLSLEASLQGIELIDESINPELIVLLYNEVGFTYIRLENYSEAEKYLEIALDKALQYQIKDLQAKVLNNTGTLYYSQRDYQTAVDYYKKSLELRKELGQKEEIAKSLYNLIIALENQDSKEAYKQALKYVDELIDLYTKIGNSSKVAQFHNTKGDLYYSLSEYEKALNNYLQELRFRQSFEDPDEMGQYYFDVAKIYNVMKNYEKAVENYERVLNYYNENSVDRAQVLTQLGNVYYGWGKYNEALKYYQESLDIANDKSSLKGKAILLNNIGLVYKNMGNYNEALRYCKMSIDIREESGRTDDLNLYFPLTSLAEIYLRLGNNEEALIYLQRALRIAENFNNSKLKKDAHFLLYEVNNAAGYYKNSLAHYEAYNEVKDSLINEDVTKKIAEMNITYETEKKEQENLNLKKTNELQRNYFIVIFVMALILMFVIVNRYLNKQKALKLLKEKNDQIQMQHRELEKLFTQLQIKEQNLSEANATKDKFFSIIAHDLKNPMHSIILSSDLLIHKFRNMSGEQLLQLIKNINKAGSHLANLLENLLQWSRSQSGRIEFNPIKLNLRHITLDTLKYLENTADKKGISLVVDIEESLNAFADPNMISTVLRNLISNAIKFTPDGGYVKMFSIITNGRVSITVEDSGIGISEEDIAKLFRIDVHHTTIGTSKEQGTGLGLILCKEFIEKNNGSIEVSSQEGKGSRFTIHLPLYQPVSVEKAFSG